MAMLDQELSQKIQKGNKPFVNNLAPLWMHTRDYFADLRAFWGARLALHKHIQLRKRYVFTRCGSRIRLRYLTLCVSMLVMGVSTVFMAASASVSMMSAAPEDRAIVRLASFNPADIAPAAGDSAENMPETHLMHEVSANVPAPDVKPLLDADGNVSEAIIEEEKQESFVTRITDSLQRHISFPVIARKPSMPREKIVKLGKGDTIAGILQNNGIGGSEAYRIAQALNKHYDVRLAKPGQEISLQFAPAVDEGAPRNIQKVAIKIDPVKEVVVRKSDENNFRSEISKKDVESVDHVGRTEIETSLYGSALRAGIPAPVVAELIRIYSWDVDFQRDIRRGDKIEVLYNTYETEDGDFARYGDVLYANISVGGKPLPVYRFKTDDGRVDYYEPDGQSIKKALMKTPVDGARLSSGYGMRHHPVLGYNKMHKGLDFAAPIGTPIYAAGDGVVEKIGPNSSYGNYIRIRHNSTLKTAYAHMNSFKRGLKRGDRVQQGDIIGYIGTTGRSTGPHLHYEVLVQNEQVNPGRVDLPVGEKLKGTIFANFKSTMSGLRDRYAALADGTKYAQNNSASVR